MMEWFFQIQDLFLKLVDPQSIIALGGLYLVTAVIFAETGLLVGFFLPGDSLLFLIGMYAATTPEIGIQDVMLFLTLAAILGDNTGYWIGRTSGPRIFKRRKSWFFKPEYVTMTRNFYDRHGAKALVLGRFLPIIRTFAPVLAGVVRLDYRKFVFFSISGGILWVCSLTALGFYLGTIDWIRNSYHYIVIGFIILTTIPLIRWFISESRKSSMASSAEGEQSGGPAAAPGPDKGNDGGQAAVEDTTIPSINHADRSRSSHREPAETSTR